MNSSISIIWFESLCTVEIEIPWDFSLSFQDSISLLLHWKFSGWQEEVHRKPSFRQQHRFDSQDDWQLHLIPKFIRKDFFFAAIRTEILFAVFHCSRILLRPTSCTVASESTTILDWLKHRFRTSYLQAKRYFPPEVTSTKVTVRVVASTFNL